MLVSHFGDRMGKRVSDHNKERGVWRANIAHPMSVFAKYYVLSSSYGVNRCLELTKSHKLNNINISGEKGRRPEGRGRGERTIP